MQAQNQTFASQEKALIIFRSKGYFKTINKIPVNLLKHKVGGGGGTFIFRQDLPVNRPLSSPNDPIFHFSPHSMSNNLFSHDFNIKLKFCHLFSCNWQIFTQIWPNTQLRYGTPNDPLFWEVRPQSQKALSFWIPHLSWPLFTKPLPYGSLCGILTVL